MTLLGFGPGLAPQVHVDLQLWLGAAGTNQNPALITQRKLHQGLGAEPHRPLIGADRVCPDGSLVNGIPSLLLAEHTHGVVPLYVAAETFKLDDGEHVEEGFETVPPRLIAGYVTDRGVVQPDQVWKLRGTT